MAGNAVDACLAACNTDLNASCIETCLDTEGFAVESTGGSGIPLAASLSLAPVLLCLSALFSGLTLGILSLDIVSLKVIESAGDPKEREYAKQILPLRRRGNLLLCTLLLGNTLVNNAVSILLADLTSGIVGLIASVFLVLIFGEITPQAVCSRYGLAIGAHARWFLLFFRALFFPITYPLAWILDRILGRDIGQMYSLDEIKHLLELHATDPDAQAESGLTSHDHRLLLGALEYKHKRVADVMTGIDNCFMLEDTQRLNFATMLNIYRSGFTRIPVYHGDRRNVVGVLYAKDLILADPEDELEINTILSFRGRYEAQIAEDTLLDKALQQFLTSGRHMMLVHKAGWRPGPVTAAKIDATQTTRASFGALAVNGRPGSAPGLNGGAGGSQHGTASALPSLENQVLNAEVTGILTLEDVIEELLKTEILDETDQWEDVNARIPRRDKARRDTRDLEVFLASFERSYGGGARTLAAPEVAAITAFLSVNVPEFAALGRSDAALKGLIRSAELVERTDEPSSPGLHGGGDVAPQETALLPQSRDSSVPQSPRSGGHAGNVWDAARWQADEELRLYAQGEPSDRFTLVLQGRVLVHTSAEGFSFELGPWSVLGNRALSDLRFVADFDAVAVPPCRLLRVKRESYKAALRAASYDAIVGSHSLRQELRRDRARSAGPGTFDGIELSSIPEVQSWTELSPREHVTIDVQREAAKKSDDDKDDEASKRP